MKNIGKRIVVIGSPGSGKSTFARKLAEIIEIPLVHLDKEYWNAGWVETPRDEWIKKQKNMISAEEWIIDGNYSSTLSMRIEKADTIICFRINRVKCIQGYFKRLITNINKKRPDMAEGCPEKFDFEFMKYIWDFPKKSGKKNIEILEKNKDKQLIIFRSRGEANKFLKELVE
ncbi:DNA topology modulation protein [Clostridium sp. DL1XJH146]